MTDSTTTDIVPDVAVVVVEDDDGDTGSVYSIVPRSYQEDDDIAVTSTTTHRGNGPHSGRYHHHGTNGEGKQRKYQFHDGGGGHGSGNFISNDPGHMRTFQWVQGRSVPVEFYMTKYTQGTSIRNAVSGIREHRMYVGKKEEYSLFKVKLAISDMGQESSADVQNAYGTLFYNSPEEYERHFYTTVPQRTKEQWMERLMSIHRHATTANNVDTMTTSTATTTTTAATTTNITGWFRNTGGIASH
jgi:hypothetical protein